MSMKRAELLSRLEKLLPAQFEEVLFHLRLPSGQLSGVSAPQGIRGIEVLRHLENTGELARLEPLLSSYGGATGVSVASAQPLAPARPVPAYPDAEMEALSKRLEKMRARRERLHAAGMATDYVEREILKLRRQLREGGQLHPGDALEDGRYLLTRVVGRGGFATVWDAHDCNTQQRVAIKVLHANLAGDLQRRERFFRGARAMMKLVHPAVVRVLEPKGEDGGFYYFVMEFVPGGNLREAVITHCVKASDVLPIIVSVGDALALAHAIGMIHRDIKPANILLDEESNPKLTDFDLVSAHDTTGGTRTGALGTVVYAAPECLDRPQDATARADVYGLGMTAIFSLAGRELSMDTFRNPGELISKLDCPGQVRNVLRRAVAWEPGHRFADAAVMGSALRDAMAATSTIESAGVGGHRYPHQPRGDSTTSPLDTDRKGLALAVVGPGVEVEVELRGRTTWTIGRARDNDIVVDHPSISRHHARLHTDDRVALEALAATNRLRFGGRELAPGERVTVLEALAATNRLRFAGRELAPGERVTIEPGEAFALGALVGVIRPVSEPYPPTAQGSSSAPAEAAVACSDAVAPAPPKASPAHQAAPAARSLREELADEERRRILDALRRSGGNQSRAAELLGMPRRTLVKRLREYGIPRGRVIPDE